MKLSVVCTFGENVPIMATDVTFADSSVVIPNRLIAQIYYIKILFFISFSGYPDGCSGSGRITPIILMPKTAKGANP
jgi:hypothetical protein